MPAALIELFEGRSTDIAGKLAATIPYAIFGAADETDAKATALASIPTTYNGIPRSGISGLECINATTWKVTARYAQPDSSGGSDTAVLENTFTFETGGGTQTVRQSFDGFSNKFVAGGPPGGTWVDSAINFDGENVNGVDIVIPQYQWAETFWFDPALVTNEYRRILANRTSTVNASAFRGYDAGEVMFLGASGSKQGNGWWQITFKFARERNRTGLQIGAITGISKTGWQYMWVRYEDDVADNSLIKKPKAVHVETLYTPYEWDSMGIGS